MVRSFARKRRSLFALIVYCGQLVIQFCHHRQNLVDWRSEENSQGVVARFQRLFRVDPPGAKHIVSVQERLIVQEHLRIGVETLEHQLHVLAIQDLWRDFKRRSVFPVCFADPLLLLFVIAIERIFDQLVCEQIRVNATRNSRPVPICFSGLTELPARVNRHDSFAGPRRTAARLSVNGRN